LVGDAKPALEFRFDAHLRQHRADLRTAAVNDDRVDAGLLQQRDVAGESFAELGIAHGMATVFDDDRLVFVTLHVGQCLEPAGAPEFRFRSRSWGTPQN
jgi:hypothetical protein